MDYVIEMIYSIIESILITSFIAMYFDMKPRFSETVDIFISFVLICILDTLMTIFEPPWIVTLFSMIFLLICILEIFYNGNILEHILISTISAISLALIDVCVFTCLSWILGIEYKELVTISNISRFLAVLITKVIYLIFAGIIASFKKKIYIYASSY